MPNKGIVVLAGAIMILSLSAPAFADGQMPSVNAALAQANQAVQTAKQAEQAETSAYQALVLQVKSALAAALTSSSASSDIKLSMTTLQADLDAASSAKTVSQLKTALNTLARDTEKMKNSLDNQGDRPGTEQRNSLKNVLAESQQSLSKFVSDVQQQVSKVVSLTAVSSGSSKEQIKQLLKAASRLNKDVEKMKEKFDKWDRQIEQRLVALQAVSKGIGLTGQTPNPPAPPSSGANSGTTPTPPPPPSNP